MTLVAPSTRLLVVPRTLRRRETTPQTQTPSGVLGTVFYVHGGLSEGGTTSEPFDTLRVSLVTVEEMGVLVVLTT